MTLCFIVIIFIVILGVVLLHNDIFVPGITLLGLSAVCAVGLLVANDHADDRRKEFYEAFENGMYTVNVEKCFEVYDDEEEEELQKVLVVLSNVEDKNMQIQKCCDEHFVVTVNNIHYVLSNNVVQKLVKEEAISLT